MKSREVRRNAIALLLLLAWTVLVVLIVAGNGYYISPPELVPWLD